MKRSSGEPSLLWRRLERRLAYSEILLIRLSILIFTDSLDVVTGAMNKGVGVFAG